MSLAPSWTIASVRAALQARKISARELAADFYARIDKRNPELNAFLTLSPERAFAQADRVDAAVTRGEDLPPLAGVPIAVKDVISTEGIRTTCGSKILEHYIPPYDATAVQRLEQAGAVILGKTNCDEFAMGSSNENSAYGPVRNPLAPDRVPGGSSGGSTVMSVIAGIDENDSTSAPVPVGNYAAEVERPLEGVRIGVPEDYFGEGLDSEVNEKVRAGIALLERLGCRRIPLHMPHTDYAIATYYIIATAEASSNLARYDGVRYGLRVPGATLAEMYRKTRERGFGAEVKRRIMLGTYALSAGYYDAYYLRAQKVRSLIARDFSDAFQKVDAIVTPTTPTPAFRLGEKTADPLQMYLADIYTVTGSLAGVPGISIPAGKTKAGLPVGMQIFGRHFAEGRVLQLAHAFERAGGFSL
jgi:aspartyl-tRNA(Asn)/glutamyl-tRNA(Gln) amidotransferase subunit A